MMILLRSFALVLLACGIGAAHFKLFGTPVQWDLAPNQLATPGVSVSKQLVEGADTPTNVTPEDSQEVDPGVVDDPRAQTGDPPAHAVVLGQHVGLEGAVLLYEMAMNGEGAIVDARRREEYEQGHILGAYHLPPGAFSGGAVPNVVRDFLITSQPVLIYCNGGDCDDSKNVGIKLQEIGFTQIHIFDDGYPAWADAGYDTATGGDP